MSRRWSRGVDVAVLGLVALVALAAVLTATPAAAQRSGAEARELGLEMQVGHGGRNSGARWVPVTITVEPARLLRGELTVSTRSISGAASEVVAIEAAARTRRVYRFLVPNGPVSVRVEEAGRDPVEIRGQAPAADRAFTIGWLGAQVPDGVPAVRSEPLGIEGAWAAVEPEWLSVSPQALEMLGALVASSSTLAGLGPESVAVLRAAVIGGTDLVIAADASGDLPDLGLPLPAVSAIAAADAGGGRALEARPDTWTVTPAELAGAAGAGDADGDEAAGDGVLAARMTAGRGTVTVVATDLGAGDLGRSADLWSLLVEAPTHMNLRQGDFAADVVPFQAERLFSSERSAAPSLPWLALFIIAYVLVVGPVNGLVLRRLGRRELAWATVPMVTVIFTTGAFLGVTGSRPSEGLAGRALVSLDGVATEIVAAGVRAPTEGTRTIALEGEDWTARTLTSGGRGSTLRRTSGGVTADLELGGLQFGGVVASRPTAEQPPLEIEAVTAGDSVTVRVRNTGGQEVEGVIVRVATATRSAGTLGAGEEREVEVAVTSLPRIPAYRDPFQGLRSDRAATLEALLRADQLDGSPGTAWVIGTLPIGPGGVEVGGLAPQDRGTLIAAGATVTVTVGDGVSPFAIQREAFSPGRRGGRPSPLALDDVDEALLRFQLPPGADAGQLRAQLEAGQDGMRRTANVWEPAARRWLTPVEAFPDGVGDPARLLDPLGVAWVRIQGDLYPLDYSGTSIDGLTEAGR